MNLPFVTLYQKPLYIFTILHIFFDISTQLEAYKKKVTDFFENS